MSEMRQVPSENEEDWFRVDALRWRMYMNAWKRFGDEWCWTDIEYCLAERKLLDERYSLEEERVK